MEATEQRIFADLGAITVTRGVYELSKRNPVFGQFVEKSLARFTLCDWGDLCQEDKEMNEISINPANDAGRVLARYNSPEAEIFITTEWDRSATTILFPSEY